MEIFYFTIFIKNFKLIQNISFITITIIAILLYNHSNFKIYLYSHHCINPQISIDNHKYFLIQQRDFYFIYFGFLYYVINITYIIVITSN
jgi:hypothetical protein